MASPLLRFSIAFLFISLTSISFSQKFGFSTLLERAPDDQTVFCVLNNESNNALLDKEGVSVKFSSSSWLFINASPSWIDVHTKNGSLDNYYFEYAPPLALADSSRAHHFVNEVHSGNAPLGVAYTGRDVIIGVVDQGIDWLHPDFIDANGNTRVLRYWDQANSGPTPPAPYGYGQEWDSTDINNGTCTSTEEASAHGSTVTGIAAGNGFANGANMGIAPDANLVIVESNFSSPNWTLTIADAVDYIFSIADEYNMPAVANLSLGTYIGSHDGNDPAAEMMETLLDEKGGRLVVSATGNSGAKGTYHQQGNPNADTNFVWFLNNPSASLGANTIFFDLWSDNADATYDFALGADSPGYDFRGRTQFYGATSSLGTPIFDTIWNSVNRIATIEVYTETIGNNYHMQLFVSNVDSTDYLFRFETTGSGKYDLWSGEWLGYNDMVLSADLPSAAQMPNIIDYVLADSTQTLVSSWNCSKKVVSVGNMKNRQHFIDMNLNQYTSTHLNSVGELSPNSSKGPTRHAANKPDVTAAGDVTLASGPLWVVTNPAYNALVDSGGYHVINGGTSMASPVVSGIGALYFERCNKATYQDFLTDAQATSYTDVFTGAVPNNAYGYGKIHAFDLLQEVSAVAQPSISWGGGTALISSNGYSYQWYLNGEALIGETGQNHISAPPYGSYEVEVISAEGCTAFSDPLVTYAGINELANHGIKVYPNPTESSFKIESNDEIIDINILDLTGKSISIDNFKNNNIDLAPLTTGTYFLSIRTVKGTSTIKIVKI
ncbi:MAG: S8 family serine peptidase [Crocinitomicaceae bacterium]